MRTWVTKSTLNLYLARRLLEGDPSISIGYGMSPNAYPVSAFSDLVCPLWLPVFDPFQAVFADRAQIVASDMATPVVRYFFSWAP